MKELLILTMVVIQAVTFFFTFYTLVNIDKKNREIKRLRKHVKMCENYSRELENELESAYNSKFELSSKLSVTEHILEEQSKMLDEAKTNKTKKGVKK